MLIVIEGVDATGKTELANRLRVMLGYENTTVIHAGVPTKHPLEEYEVPIRWYRPGSGRHVILDRWHLGEYVWPTIFERETKFDKAVQRHLNLFMQSRGAHYVHAWREEWNIRRTIRTQEILGDLQPKELKRRLPEALALFEYAIAQTGQGCSQWNFDIESSDSTLRGIVAFAQDLEEQVAPVYDVTREWIGSPTPEAILVGEVFGPLRPGQPEWADVPFPAHPATSGHYLMGALPPLAWRRLAIVNAYRGRTRRQNPLGRIQEVLGGAPLIALGNAAAAVLKTQDLEYAQVSHPQFHRRFHFHNPLGYTEQLTKAMQRSVMSPWS